MDRYNVESVDQYDMEPAQDGMWVMYDDAQDAIAAAVARAIATERERCAKLCEGMRAEDGPHAYAWAIRTEWADDADGPNTNLADNNAT